MTSVPASWTFRSAWIVLFLGSFPIILDYIEHVLSHSWAWYVWVFPVGVVLSTSRADKRASHTVPAILLVLLGIASEVYASASGMLSLGRPGFLLAASGLMLADGRLDLRRFVLMALAIPIPYALLNTLGEPLLFLNLNMLTSTLQAVEVPALATLQGVQRPSGMVIFKAVDVGWTSAIFAFGLAWMVLERRESSWTRTLTGSGIAAALGFVIHLLCTTVLFALSEPSTIASARIGRDVLSYCVIAMAAGCSWVLLLRTKTNDG